MAASHDLSRLGAYEFEHLVNQLALQVLGSGHSLFGPGSDGGRDGYFEGTAPYPSAADHWTGKWYIQSKFLAPRIGVDPQKWLLGEIRNELAQFADRSGNRKWPDIWIVASNVDPSGVPETGAFDRAFQLVKKARPKLASKFHIWGGKKILDLLSQHEEIRDYFLEFITPGHVLREVYEHLSGQFAGADKVLQYLIVRQFSDQRNSKLEQAGSHSDTRPGIHKLFIDVPIRIRESGAHVMALDALSHASANSLRPSLRMLESTVWRPWRRDPTRARAWFLRGGPGRGKTTIGQFFSQIHRAAWIAHDSSKFAVRDEQRDLVREVERTAKQGGYWPNSPRIPLQIDLKDYASWISRRLDGQPRGILSFTAARLGEELEREVRVGLLEDLLRNRRWFVSFDGLDEVPQDSKEFVASQVLKFIDEIGSETDCDLLATCTSRPQGYAGQFDRIDGPTLDLIDLSPDQALACARPLVSFERSAVEAGAAITILEEAINSPAVQQLMTTPLQSHIMAVIVRDGGRPPDRRWNLFRTFYEVIRRREANKNFPEKDLAKLLQEELLLKTIHNRLGFLLHSRAERSSGAEGSINREEFRTLVKGAVLQIKTRDIDRTVDLVVSATTERLVLVSTPEEGSQVRFDIRQLQEFFAAEFIHEAVEIPNLEQRLKTIAGDSHWYEVVQFVLGALVELGKRTELSLASQILISLNVGDGSNASRTVMGRAAMGSRLVARLLRDGVLEQDLRNRILFAPAFEPFAAATTAQQLDHFMGFRHPDSRSWMIETLLRQVDAKKEPESIGAAVLLSMLLTDKDPEASQFKAYLLKSTPGYANYVLMNCISAYYSEDGAFNNGSFNNIPNWCWDAFYTIIKRVDWSKYLPNAMDLLDAALGSRRCSAAARRSRIHKSAISAAKLFLGTWTRDQRREPVIEYGVLRQYYYEQDWTVLKAGGITIPNVDTAALQAEPGLFGIVGSILTFATNPSAANLRSCATKLLAEWPTLDRVPSMALFALLPLSEEYPYTISEQLRKLASISDDEFKLLLDRHLVGDVVLPRPGRSHFGGTPKEGADWTVFAQARPATSIAVQLHHAGISGNPQTRTSTEFPAPEQLVQAFERFPLLLAKWLWALDPIKQALGHEYQNRLSVVLQKALEATEAFLLNERWGYGRDVKALTLTLPKDCNALPCLLRVAIRDFSRPSEDPQKQEEVVERLKRLVTSSVIDGAKLQAVSSDRTKLLSVRASAVALTLLHQAVSCPCKDLHAQLEDLGYTNIPDWICTAIASLVCLIYPPWNPDAIEVLAAILDAVNEKYYARDIVVKSLENWRETSLVPVTSSGLDNAWLAQ
jgi:hypothetical protein